MLRIESDCTGFNVRHSVIGLEISPHSLNQSDVKVKSFARFSLAFSALSPAACFYIEFSLAPRHNSLCSDWLLWLLCDFVGQLKSNFNTDRVL